MGTGAHETLEKLHLIVKLRVFLLSLCHEISTLTYKIVYINISNVFCAIKKFR